MLRDLLTVPNLMSMSRIPLAIVFPMVNGTGARLALVAVAAWTDWADGRLARGGGRTTRAGELLDPVADRTFMAVAIVTLLAEHQIPAWSVPLLLLRDIGVAVGGGVLLTLDRAARLPARRAGKGLTWFQFAAIGVILLRPSMAAYVAVPAAVLGSFALADYGRAALQLLRSDRSPAR